VNDANTGIQKEYIDSVEKHGYEWHVWTVNYEKTAGKMKALGSRSTTTDVPGRMRKYIAE